MLFRCAWRLIFYHALTFLHNRVLSIGGDILNQFAFLNQSGCVERKDGVDDAQQYAAVQQAMCDLGFEAAEQACVLDVVAAVLHIGNITFTAQSAEAAGAASAASAAEAAALDPACEERTQRACSLLGVDAAALRRALCEKFIVTPDSSFAIAFSPTEAANARDSLAKTVYGALFDWLVRSLVKV